MKITKTYNWHRRDFCYDAKCENCGRITQNNSGYDDINYYNNVVPDIHCPKCKKSTNEINKENDLPIEILIPKYDPNITI